MSHGVFFRSKMLFNKYWGKNTDFMIVSSYIVVEKEFSVKYMFDYKSI